MCVCFSSVDCMPLFIDLLRRLKSESGQSELDVDDIYSLLLSHTHTKGEIFEIENRSRSVGGGGRYGGRLCPKPALKIRDICV